MKAPPTVPWRLDLIISSDDRYIRSGRSTSWEDASCDPNGYGLNASEKRNSETAWSKRVSWPALYISAISKPHRHLTTWPFPTERAPQSRSERGFSDEPIINFLETFGRLVIDQPLAHRYLHEITNIEWGCEDARFLVAIGHISHEQWRTRWNIATYLAPLQRN